MTEQTCLQHIDHDGIAFISLNRPKVHNALDEKTVNLLLNYLQELEESPSVRAIVLLSSGKNFCVGADLKWMQSINKHITEGKDPIAQKLAELMSTLYYLYKPTIAMIQGAVYGGGAGLVACCDIALASRDAHFCFSEVRLGLIPSVISPYVVRAIGERTARRYFLTAEQFNAEEAHRIGLVHEIADEVRLQVHLKRITNALIAGGPCALTRTKELVDEVSSAPLDNTIMLKTTEWISDIRQTPEAREGIDAFYQKRKPSWLKNGNEKS